MKAVVSQGGSIQAGDVPEPKLEDGCVLVQTEYSAISPGTEIMMNGHSYSSPTVLGYSAAGVVKAVGKHVDGIQVGQRVACYGAPYVKHAEWLSVPKHLAVPVPDHVSLMEASTVGLGAIAIHALRQASLQFGETMLLIGAGILGQITAQIAQAAGYRVIVSDLIKNRCRKAEELGIRHVCRSNEQVEAKLKELTDGRGADAVLVCASSKTGELMDQSLKWIRDRGKVVVVGDLKLDFSRELMFSKEAQVLISRAGGPGRYDSIYEKEGFDYPIGYVRWTEGRNMEEYIRLMAEGDLQVGPLLTEVYPIEQCAEAYRRYSESPYDILGAVLEYPAASGLTEQEEEAAPGARR
ncbi:zinc-binding alcohol dehydrogenase [Paenibacillus sp. J2TS4]|uniref:zinc-dependent alcohol dehydrogenase n=1 Tax=Paenibacillus sp. J2TS4 TaxID=2807194 RepID=UPI001B2CF152|nr:zinc-binding alcohol dehydrogenase [Paenibacillus sp. J2TS4]GIP33401.1 hypothetical protein J2TS4_26110 [Paenibacillus sp. J2TS4]